MTASAAWIAVDWGTSNLRAWALEAAGRPMAAASSHAGMGGLARDDFELALVELVEGWLQTGRRTDAVACGMAGTRQGWVEAGYAAIPCSPSRGRRWRTRGWRCISCPASARPHPRT